MKVRARVYTKDGNRFLIPGHWYSDDDDGIGLGCATNVLIESAIFSAVCAMQASDWMEIDTDETGIATLHHYPCDLIAPEFKHGSIGVWLIGGPMYDEGRAKAEGSPHDPG